MRYIVSFPVEIARNYGVEPVGLVDRVNTELDATLVHLRKIIPNTVKRGRFSTELAKSCGGRLNDFAVEVPDSIVDDRGRLALAYLPYFVAHNLAKKRGEDARVESHDVDLAFSMLRKLNFN
ncbi:MAG: hypothetical protein AABY10_00260 [Nanoarchaeota archaeon]